MTSGLKLSLEELGGKLAMKNSLCRHIRSYLSYSNDEV